MSPRRKIETAIVVGGLALLFLAGCQQSPTCEIQGGSNNSCEFLIEGDPTRGGQTTDANADISPL